jgi:hypothetical protein
LFGFTALPPPIYPPLCGQCVAQCGPIFKPLTVNLHKSSSSENQWADFKCE